MASKKKVSSGPARGNRAARRRARNPASAGAASKESAARLAAAGIKTRGVGPTGKTGVKDAVTRRRTLRGIEFQPVTPKRWGDMVELFGERGACAGCWCMWWRGTRADYNKNQGAGNKRRMKRLIDSGFVPGIIAYSGGEPVGWCSIGPRESYDALDRSRVLKRVDDKPVWSIVCFFVAKQFRRKGLSVHLIKAAVKYAKSRGAKIVEGYPVVPKVGYPDAWAYPGFVTAFQKAGFRVAKKWSKVRPIMRHS